MLTGRLPFSAEDAAGWIHAHLALRPAPLGDLGSGVDVLSPIIVKLLEKEPSARYQSATGLVRDLEFCRDALNTDNARPVLELGAHDVPTRVVLAARPSHPFVDVDAAYDGVGLALFHVVLLDEPHGGVKARNP